MNKIFEKTIKNIGISTTRGVDGFPCQWFLGQPKMPKALVEKEMAKDAE